MMIKTSTYANVVVDVPTRALGEPLDYAIPVSLEDRVRVGVPVLVPLGSTKAVGYVVRLALATDVREVKAIDAVLGEPLFDENAIQAAEWISQHYLAPLSEALRLFLPPGGSPRLVRGYRASGDRPTPPDAVFDLAARDDGVSDSELGRPDCPARRHAASLATAGILQRTYSLLPPRVTPTTERFARLVGDEPPLIARNATMQRAVIAALANGPVSVSELRAELGAVDGALRRLSELGSVELLERERLRLPSSAARHAPRHEVLSAGQTDALHAIARMRSAGGGTILLDGVTGSGKTEVYLRAIEDVISDGGRAIVLVPEISLTPQTVGRFRSRFGERVAVLHSRLSDGERYDQWRLALAGEVDVVVGARSALFAPLPDVQLVVIDEEHEASYKQSASPRYHARDVAMRICATRSAVLVLGSATPSMESRDAAARGEITRVAMAERVGGGAPPTVEVVDMGAEFADGHRSMFSRSLLRGLEEVRDSAEKAVLFLNRRGYASFLLCRECGYVPECDSCAVSLTYHDRGNVLLCHHCGAQRPVPPVCPRCSSPFLRRFGAGTQRVEEELARLVPELPVVRMDADTTSGKGGHERALSEFESLACGVLLGTQMVAKGLDYPDVTLVGVINADTTMHLPDFRAAERTYQLLEQVTGRAGRGVKPGRVVIQTYWPDHPAVTAVTRRDPEAVYAPERKSRASLGYPPYVSLVNVVISSASSSDARTAAMSLGEALRSACSAQGTVLGPAPAPIAKLKDRHRWHVLIKAPRGADLSTCVGQALRHARKADGVTVIADVDPVDLL